MNGTVIAVLGLALCMICCGIGSAIGLYKAGTAASAAIAEDDKKFAKVFVLAVLPATQGLYGFVITIIGLGSVAAGMDVNAGLAVLGSVLPMAIVGLASAILQGAYCGERYLRYSQKRECGRKNDVVPRDGRNLCDFVARYNHNAFRRYLIKYAQLLR